MATITDPLASQKANIKNYVLVINPDIVDDDVLDYVIDSVVERALIFMNRLQLDNEDVTDFYTDTETVPAVLPAELERTLAETVTGALRTINANPTAGVAATQVQDNGQSVTFSDKIGNYFHGNDADIFSSSLGILSKYRLPKIIGTTRRF